MSRFIAILAWVCAAVRLVLTALDLFKGRKSPEVNAIGAMPWDSVPYRWDGVDWYAGIAPDSVVPHQHTPTVSGEPSPVQSRSSL
jgi:hypothetical protein